MRVLTSTPSRTMKLSTWQRVRYVGLGAVLILVGTALALLFGALFLSPVRPGSPSFSLGTSSVIMALVALWGAVLVRRGVRGFRPVSERALRLDPSARKMSGLVDFILLPVVALVLFLWSRGRPWALPGLEGLCALGWFFWVGYLWMPLAVAIHEAGHMAIARGFGIPFTTFRVGPVEWRREGRRLRLRWQAQGLGSTLGLAHFDDPRVFTQPKRLAWVALGGPAANVLAALAHVLAALALGGPSPSSTRGLPALLWAGALLHGVLVLSNLVPRRFASGLMSDGALWRELRGRRVTGGSRLLAQVHAEHATRRPREWSSPPEALLHAAPGEAPEIAATLRLYALTILLDRGEVSAARELLDALGPDIAPSPALRREFLLQHALVHALDTPDPARARSLFVEASRLEVHHRVYVRLAEAAVLLSEGRPADARTALTAWQEESLARGCREEWLVGNLWALERLHEALQVPSLGQALPGGPALERPHPLG